MSNFNILHRVAFQLQNLHDSKNKNETKTLLEALKTAHNSLHQVLEKLTKKPLIGSDRFPLFVGHL